MADLSALSTVVVGCDDSWQSHAAVETATHEAARRHCPLVVLTVTYTEALRGGLAAMRELEQDAAAAALATTQRAAERAAATDSTVPVHVVVADSADDPKIAQVAERAELLVVGGHGARGQSAFSLGTVSAELVRRFHAPVLVPRGEHRTSPGPWDGRPPQVLVGVSLSDEATRPLRAAARQAQLRGWPLRVVHTVPTSHPGQQLHHEQGAVWEAVHAVPECASVPCHVEVVQEATIAALANRCGPRDLLVVSTRGGGTLAGLIEGSVARGVLDASLCDVMVVPALRGTGTAGADDPVVSLQTAPRAARSTP
jgi:nucleotide-binding universal stress UspA family protein